MDAVELMRQEWGEGARRFEAERVNPGHYHRLVDELESVLDQLRRKVGQTYSLAELSHAYRDAERWARELTDPPDLAVVLAAAFHSYQRGALDYAP